jgi:hypothetical protein
MADLVAIKRLTYAGRVHRPGVAFNARTAHARLLVASGAAVLAAAPQPPMLTGLPHIYQTSDLDALRASYAAKTGKPPDSRWREKRLAKEIAAL